jgi:hypothetical protein
LIGSLSDNLFARYAPKARIVGVTRVPGNSYRTERARRRAYIPVADEAGFGLAAKPAIGR